MVYLFIHKHIHYIITHTYTLTYIHTHTCIHTYTYIISRHRFMWRNITQNNVIAVLPAIAGYDNNTPVVLVDHMDTAFAQGMYAYIYACMYVCMYICMYVCMYEDIFAKTHKRTSTPGADDNVSATCTLLRAADILRKYKVCVCMYVCMVYIYTYIYTCSYL